MKPKRKEYTTRAEKQQDFGIGVGIFIGLNVLLISMVVMLPSVLSEYVTSDTAVSAIMLCSNLLPFLANIAALLYFAFTRTWIAIGMLGTFAFILLLGLVIGIIVTVVCLSTGF